MPSEYRNYVDGEWIPSGDGATFEVRNPADIDDLIGRFQQSTAADADRAIAAATTAQPGWQSTPAPERGRILRKAAELLAGRKDETTRALSREEGKTRSEAAGEVQRVIDIFQYYAQKARDFRGTVKASSTNDRTLYTMQEPVGVVSLITPWNFPIAITAWKLAPALVTGNTVVHKPASLAPDNTRILFECLDEAGIPAGAANYLTGPGSQVGGRLTEHDAVNAVSFTGSSMVGMEVYRTVAAGKKRVQTEMGGKNPTIVMPSADLEAAIEAVGVGAFGVTGQACTACSRAIVHESMYDAFVDGVVDYAESLNVGPGLEDSDMGPQVSEGELESTLDYVEVGIREGATLETGGNRLEDGNFANGHFVEPTVFSGVDNAEMRIAQEEIFGPVVSVIPVSDFNDALETANDTQYGLSASIMTQDLREANRFVEEIEAGVAKVNERSTGLELHVPFGGLKQSSSETFREQGDAGLDFFTISKTVYMNY